MFAWSSFGKVKYKDEIYEHDICVDSKGNAAKREYEQDHVITRSELEKLLTKKTVAVVVGTGTAGCAQLSDDAMQLIVKRHLELHKFETPQAIKVYNEISPTRKTIAVIHLTC